MSWDHSRGGPPHGLPGSTQPHHPYPGHGQPQPRSGHGQPQPPPGYGAPPAPAPAAPDAWRLQRPGSRAEQMFANDPEMLAMVRSARAEPDPVKKPWWWIAVQSIFGLVGAAATSGAMFALGWGLVPDPLVPLSGLCAGMVLFLGLVGHYPGNFRVVRTDEKLVLWKPTSALLRVALFAGALVFPVIGCGLAMAR